MKYIVTIEETCAKDFLIEATSKEEALDIAERKYKTGEYTLDPGECQFKQMAITGPNDEQTDWREF